MPRRRARVLDVVLTTLDASVARRICTVEIRGSSRKSQSLRVPTGEEKVLYLNCSTDTGQNDWMTKMRLCWALSEFLTEVGEGRNGTIPWTVWEDGHFQSPLRLPGIPRVYMWQGALSSQPPLF